MRACRSAMMLAAAAAFAASGRSGTALAVPGGDLGVIPKGHYVCEIPGDPSDPALFAGSLQPEADFEVIGDSSYRAKGVRGVYFMTGDQLMFTSGTLEGKRFHRVATTFLRAVEPDGKDGDLRCVNSTQGAVIEPLPTSRCKRRAAKNVAMRKDDAPAAC